MSYSVHTINSNTDMNQNSLEYNEYFLIDASSGNIDITLPANKGDGSFYQFHRTDESNNIVSFFPSSGETVNNTTSITLPINRYVQPIKISDNWIFSIISIN